VLALAIVIRKYRIDPQKREPLGAFHVHEGSDGLSAPPPERVASRGVQRDPVSALGLVALRVFGPLRRVPARRTLQVRGLVAG
jgi:hypothetical protein